MIILIEKIGIRFLTHFLVMGIIRLFVLDGKYASFDLSVMFMCMIYALIITIFIECFDQWIVHYTHYYRYIIMGMIVIYGINILFADSIFHNILFGYLLIIMIKETWKLSTMQLALEKYQKEYQSKN